MGNENEIFKWFVSIDPNPGTKNRIKYLENYIIEIPGWSVGLKESITKIDLRAFASNIFIKTHKITKQVFYDVLELGLLSIDDRPKCPICGNTVNFQSIVRGYYITCSNKCHNQYALESRISIEARKKAVQTCYERGIYQNKKPLSKESRDKISKTRKENYLAGKIVISAEFRENARLRMLGNTYGIGNTNRRGKKLSDETKQKISKANSGRKLSEQEKKTISIRSSNYFKNNPDKLSEFIKNGLKSKRGTVYLEKGPEKGFYYMSSWELKFLQKCDLEKSIKEIQVPQRILYEFNESQHTYLPDILLILTSGKKIMIEIKPKSKINTIKNQAKFSAAREYCTNNNIIFMIISEDIVFSETFPDLENLI